MAAGPSSPSAGRRLGLLESLTVAMLVLLASGLGSALGQQVYTNTWAVHIPGGPEAADGVAQKHGFVNHGHVSTSPVLNLRFSAVYVLLLGKLENHSSCKRKPSLVLTMQIRDTPGTLDVKDALYRQHRASVWLNYYYYGTT